MTVEKAEKKSRGFFALDVDQFSRIGSLNLGIEEAATYLALMKGTDETNTISRGGIKSIMEYTGLSRAEAKRAVDHLDRHGLLQKVHVERARARTAPRYVLPQHEPRRALAKIEADIVAQIEAGQQPQGKIQINAAGRAAQKGWIEKQSQGWALLPPTRRVAFIPNTFVHAEGWQSPLKRLVQIGEIGPALLAAELYHKQDLMNERGVPLASIRSYFHSTMSVTLGGNAKGYRLHELEEGGRVDEEGNAFDQSGHPSHFKSNGTFWDDLRSLEKAHIVEWAVYSANGKPKHTYDYKRPQRPLGVLRGGKHVLNAPEANPAFVAYIAYLEHHRNFGEESRPIDQMIRSWREDSPIIAIEEAHVPHVEGVGILRMVHRAATENTAQWFRDLHQECRECLFFLENAMKAAFPHMPELKGKYMETAEGVSAISMKIND